MEGVLFLPLMLNACILRRPLAAELLSFRYYWVDVKSHLQTISSIQDFLHLRGSNE